MAKECRSDSQRLAPFRRRSISGRGAVVLSAFAIALIAPRLEADTETYKLEASSSSVRFELRHLLGTATGRFRNVRGTLRIDRDHPENATVVASVQAQSIDTGNGTRDAHLRTELFETARYPEITFRSRTVKRVGSDRADVTGDLTMHGITKPFVLHVALLQTGTGAQPRWHVIGGTLKRSDFGLSWSKGVEAVSMIGDDIRVQIDAESVPGH